MSEQVTDSAAHDAMNAGTAPADEVNTHGEQNRQSWANQGEAGNEQPIDEGGPGGGNGLLAASESETVPDFSVVEETIADPSPAPAPVERPLNIPQQFWNEQLGKVNEDALANSYNDLRKQFNKMTQDSGKAPDDFEAYLQDFRPPARARATGTQKEGDLLNRYGDLDAKDPVFVALAKAAKFANLDHAKFTDFTQVLMEEMHDILPDPFDAEKEMNLLGENADYMISTNKAWIDRLASRGVLNENQYNLMLQFGSTAEGVLLTNALRIENGEKPIPINASVDTGRKTPDECAAMMGDSRYHADGPEGDAFRAEVEKQFALTHGTEPSS